MARPAAAFLANSTAAGGAPAHVGPLALLAGRSSVGEPAGGVLACACGGTQSAYFGACLPDVLRDCRRRVPEASLPPGVDAQAFTARPDVVVLEFVSNDEHQLEGGGTSVRAAAEGFERLVRRALSLEGRPAVVVALGAMRGAGSPRRMRRDGYRCSVDSSEAVGDAPAVRTLMPMQQHAHRSIRSAAAKYMLAIASHYGLAVADVRATWADAVLCTRDGSEAQRDVLGALWYRSVPGEGRVDDHPRDAGHAFLAAAVHAVFSRASKESITVVKALSLEPLPPPVYASASSDDDAGAAVRVCISAEAIATAAGLQTSPAGGGRRALLPGAVLPSGGTAFLARATSDAALALTFAGGGWELRGMLLEGGQQRSPARMDEKIVLRSPPDGAGRNREWALEARGDDIVGITGVVAYTFVSPGRGNELCCATKPYSGTNGTGATCAKDSIPDKAHTRQYALLKVFNGASSQAKSVACANRNAAPSSPLDVYALGVDLALRNSSREGIAAAAAKGWALDNLDRGVL